MQNYDVVIKAHQKDYFKLSEVVNRLKYLDPPFENIYIVSPDGFIPICDYTDIIIAIKDEDIVPKIDKNKLSIRPSWVWVNLVSITQQFTKNDLYFDVQSDNFFMNKVKLFTDDGRPRLFKSTNNPNNNSRWPGYFNFSSLMFDLEKITYGSSFIVEFMMYDRKKLSKLFERYGGRQQMIEASYQIINDGTYPADQEIYGNLIEKYFLNEYEIVMEAQTILSGDEIPDDNFSKIENFIKEMEALHPKAIACSYHTWRVI